MEELRAKMTKKPKAEESKTKESATVRPEVPNDLVQVQAYIRWEKAGKPNYPPEKQTVMLYAPNVDNILVNNKSSSWSLIQILISSSECSCNKLVPDF